jgi:hypothetical protein
VEEQRSSWGVEIKAVAFNGFPAVSEMENGKCDIG